MGGKKLRLGECGLHLLHARKKDSLHIVAVRCQVKAIARSIAGVTSVQWKKSERQHGHKALANTPALQIVAKAIDDLIARPHLLECLTTG